MNRFVPFLAFCVAFSSAFVHVRNVRSLLKRADCVDKLNNCKAFGDNACSNQRYAEWATRNCALTCNKCQSSGGSVPVPVQGIQAGMGESLEGCVYKGVVHQQGETWKDGCTYKCTCTDGTIGKYTCTGICLQWNLPDACTMNPPAPGKCCKTPYCPPTELVLFPANYVAE